MYFQYFLPGVYQLVEGFGGDKDATTRGDVFLFLSDSDTADSRNHVENFLKVIVGMRVGGVAGVDY